MARDLSPSEAREMRARRDGEDRSAMTQDAYAVRFARQVLGAVREDPAISDDDAIAAGRHRIREQMVALTEQRERDRRARQAGLRPARGGRNAPARERRPPSSPPSPSTLAGDAA